MILWLAPVTLFAARLLWQRMPGLGTCALFWGIAAASLVFNGSLEPSLLLLGAGIGCNAAVTLANGGFMPVSPLEAQGARPFALGPEAERATAFVSRR